MKMMKWIAAVGAMAMASAANAAVITVGSHTLLPNLAGQQVQLFVTGGEMIQGIDFNLQVADGGPGAFGTIVGPKITAVDLMTGTVFAGNSGGSSDPGSVPQLAIRAITTNPGTFVAANGLLATVTVDTTGFATGTWAFSMSSTANGPTKLFGVPNPVTTILDGSLAVVVPEPAGMAGAAFLVGGLLLRRR